MTNFKYALRDTCRLLFRHWGLSLLTLLTASCVLYLLGFTALFALNVRHMVSRVERGLVIQAYMKKGEKADEALSRLQSAPYVTSVKAISPDEALERLRAKLGNQARAVTLLGENPLPWSIEITVVKAEYVTPLVRDLVSLPSVEDVIYSGKLAERLSTVSKASSGASALILILAVVISSLVIFNTIRIAIYSRMEEIEVMLLIGATRTYISLPFVLQGMFLGAGGALIAVAALWGTYMSIVEAIRSSLSFLDIINDHRMIGQFFLLLFGTGTTLGWICSWAAVSRFTSKAMRPR